MDRLGEIEMEIDRDRLRKIIQWLIYYAWWQSIPNCPSIWVSLGYPKMLPCPKRTSQLRHRKRFGLPVAWQDNSAVSQQKCRDLKSMLLWPRWDSVPSACAEKKGHNEPLGVFWATAGGIMSQLMLRKCPKVAQMIPSSSWLQPSILLVAVHFDLKKVNSPVSVRRPTRARAERGCQCPHGRDLQISGSTWKNKHQNRKCQQPTAPKHVWKLSQASWKQTWPSQPGQIVCFPFTTSSQLKSSHWLVRLAQPGDPRKKMEIAAGVRSVSDLFWKTGLNYGTRQVLKLIFWNVMIGTANAFCEDTCEGSTFVLKQQLI